MKKMKLDYSRRETVLKNLREESKADNGYFLLLILAVIITILGLLIDSPAIIIGGMIVAPLLYPMISVGASIVTGDEKNLKKSLSLTVRSSLIAIAVGFLVTFISPIQEQTHEILTRVEPTLIDLIVALAAGAVGAYASARKQRVASLTGVVISAALVPPLAITGYGIAIGEFDLVLGSFLLYFANLIAVIVATILIYYLLGFRPGRSEEKRVEATKDLAISVFLLIIITVILTLFLVTTIAQARQTQIIEQNIHVFLKNYTDTELIELEQKELPAGLLIKATLQGPSTFTQTALNLLDDELEANLKRDVNLQILQIPVTKIVEKEE